MTLRRYILAAASVLPALLAWNGASAQHTLGFIAGYGMANGRFQPQQDAQQRGLAAAGAAHQHHGAFHRPGKALQNRRTAEAFAEIGYHNAHTRTSPQRRVLAVRSRAADAADSAADSSTMTSVHANTSGVDRVIFAR